MRTCMYTKRPSCTLAHIDCRDAHVLRKHALGSPGPLAMNADWSQNKKFNINDTTTATSVHAATTAKDLLGAWAKGRDCHGVHASNATRYSSKFSIYSYYSRPYSDYTRKAYTEYSMWHCMARISPASPGIFADLPAMAWWADWPPRDSPAIHCQPALVVLPTFNLGLQ